MSGRLALLIGLFTAVMVTSNISAAKILELGQWIVPGGVFLFAITFLITDTISEVWGKQWARRVIWFGLFGNIIAMAYLQLVAALPYPYFWTGQEAFEQTVALVPTITIAGIVAYLVSQHHDVWAFHFWKRITKGKYLWLRNILSTAVSQLIDTVLFITIAFAWFMPLEKLVGLIIGQYTFKLLLALLDTPLCYLLVRWVRKEVTESKTGV